MYNFDTRAFQNSADIEALDDDQIVRFLPVFPGNGGGPARGLYRCYRALGKGKTEALAEVLRQATGTVDIPHEARGK